MRKIICTILLALATVFAFAQNSGAIKFLGIPIDGTEAQFTTQLKAKGFRYNSVNECYKGQFNGKEVDVYVHTNHNLVDRVYVAFPATSEESIRIEFNRLLGQFKDNGKYMDLVFNEEIPTDDDISYEITVHNKRYQASFSYFDLDRDPIELANGLLDKCSEFFTPDQLAKMKELVKASVDASQEEQEALQQKLMAEMQETITKDSEFTEEKAFRVIATFMDGMRELADGDVWFMIHERYGRYNIGLYYDNRHNQAHGEDL